MAVGVSRQLESRWLQLLGFALDTTNYDTWTTPSMWLPVKGTDNIEDTTKLEKIDAGQLGQLLPKSTLYDYFGFGSGKLKIEIPAVPIHNNITHLLAELMQDVTTAANAPGYAHTLKFRDAAGKTMNQDLGLSFTEIRDAGAAKLSGCRIASLKITQEQNKPMAMSLELEGATYAQAASSGITPSLTLITAHPWYKFVDFTASIGGPGVAVTSAEIEIKVKLTSSDSQQTLQSGGTVSRNQLHIVGIDGITIKFKRAYAFDGTNQSTYEADYYARTARAITMQHAYAGATVQYKMLFTATAARLMSLPKRSISDGIVMEELDYTVLDNGTDEPLTLLIWDDSATPATRSWT